MSDPKLNYIGPVPEALTYQRPAKPFWRKVPLAFVIVVIVPSVVAAFYFFLLASDRYVSEARFIVRMPQQTQPSSLGVALQGVGLSTGSSDAFAVHEYVNSRDGLRDLSRRINVKAILKGRNADIFSRYPSPWQTPNEEDTFHAYQKRIVVGYDSTTGISTLRTEAFSPQDARAMAEGLLEGGEQLINRMNERASTDAVTNAQSAVEQARAKLTKAQIDITNFRNREKFIDPARSATESGSLIGGLLETVAGLRAERAQIANQAPQSPQLPGIDGRIAAYESQIAAERAKIVGDSGSLAPKIADYENLVLAREFADRELAQATAAVLSAQQDASRQRLYLDRVVNPDLADKSTQPRRLMSFLTVLFTSLMLYGVGWLIWAGIKEHQQT
ncbi:chain-length determining protein [Brevundimonas goettingensis]|uniref:Chain-length determining protein n=1 Tax=Brevundimonas goettingensis TaxID=2774190 RepID=A0A975GY37_9CAUL|nr:chain-length determining protein [Brevundimonas goettingensis]QTC91180.1 chain-length determining protein [Brevundimonas goettingensis]